MFMSSVASIAAGLHHYVFTDNCDRQSKRQALKSKQAIKILLYYVGTGFVKVTKQCIKQFFKQWFILNKINLQGDSGRLTF